MAEFQVADASLRRLNAAVTVIVCAAAVGVAYWYERAWRRWVEQHDPFAAPRARFEHAKSTYRGRRALVAELGQIIAGSTDAGRPGAAPARDSSLLLIWS
jgi:hypothetical protein